MLIMGHRLLGYIWQVAPNGTLSNAICIMYIFTHMLVHGFLLNTINMFILAPTHININTLCSVIINWSETEVREKEKYFKYISVILQTFMETAIKHTMPTEAIVYQINTLIQRPRIYRRVEVKFSFWSMNLQILIQNDKHILLDELNEKFINVYK